jgi:hypothetical protein
MHHSFVNVYVKSVPCGAVVLLQCGSHWTVAQLYRAFRSASAYGTRREAYLYLPTLVGALSLDNEDTPETDLSLGVHTALLTLSCYGLSANRSSVCLLHTCFFSRVKVSDCCCCYSSGQCILAMVLLVSLALQLQ